MITYRSQWLKYADLWFDEGCPLNDFDVVYRFGASAPVPDATNEEFHTLVIDLTKSKQEILAGFHRNTRSKIKRAEAQDGLTCDVMGDPSLEVVNEFVDYYNEFARGKGVAPVLFDRVESLRTAGALVLSRIRNAEHKLVWHAHLRVGRHALLHRSASLYRGRDKEFQNLVGRANRLLHLQDMFHFKEVGCDFYDFGGWYAGTEDQDRLRINQFKEEFGGTRVLQYNAVLNRTWRARLLKSIARRVRRTRG
jgi:hypothetical protein